MNEETSQISPKSAIVFLLGLVSLIWLLNPPLLGTLDDNIPFLGNLDEGAAALILINCLKYFGLDLTRFFDAARKNVPSAPAGPPKRVVDVESENVPPRS